MTDAQFQVATVAEFAELLKVNRRTVERMIKRGELRVIRAGRLVRIPLTEVQRCAR